MKKIFYPLLILTLFLFKSQFMIAQTCYELVWSDEFNTSGRLDSTKWTYETGNNNGNNNESQYYTTRSQNIRIEDSVLIIEARKENYSGFQYTSARINTYANHLSWKYGKIEARMKLPYGQGIWPAFWMLGNTINTGAGWPACGEIDIMELIGGGEDRDDKIYGTPHWADANNNHAQYGGSYRLNSGIFADAYHTFTVEWDENVIKWFVDGQQFHIMSLAPAELSEFKKEFFIILNLAVGGDWPGYPNASTVFPQKMYVDYVRVYQTNQIPKITGQNSVVKNQASVLYEITESEDFAYNWSVPDGASIVSGQGTHQIEVNWGCDPGNVSCQLTTLCNTYDLEFAVEFKDLEMSGLTKVAPSQANLRFEIPYQIETVYHWVLPEQVSSTATMDTNVVLVNWGSQNGTISVITENSCGKDTASLDVTVIQQLPYPDPQTPHAIPGTIASVEFDSGGEGFAYHDNEPDNQGTGSRQDEGVDTEANDGGEDVGWTLAGEWLEYTVDITESKTYDMEFRLASTNANGKFRVLFNGEDRTGTISAPSTGAWTKFKSVYKRNIELKTTDTLMRIEIVTGDFNLGRINIADSITDGIASIAKLNLHIYPTIVDTKIQVDNASENLDYELTDLLGKTVVKGIIVDQQIDFTVIQPGSYLLNISDGTATLTTKIFKIK